MKFISAILVFAALSAGLFCQDQSITDWFRYKIDGPAKVRENVFIVFTPIENMVVTLPLNDFQYLTSHPSFNKSLPSVIYIHGWLESGKLDSSVLAVRGAYLDRGDHNVICVDWSYYARNFHYDTVVVPQMKIIAEEIAVQLRDFLIYGDYDIAQLHLVGHSLGGQMVGKVGRHLKKITDRRMTVPRIFALDPARPEFEDHFNDGFEPISRNDGAYVQIIHTNVGQLGMQHRVGTIDFYPDGGNNHPGCNFSIVAKAFELVRTSCNHARSWHFYEASVRHPDAFPAIRCISWDDFMSNGTCYQKDIVYMGYGANASMSGKYFLQTHGNVFNLSKGTNGIRPTKVQVTRLRVPTNNYAPLPVPTMLEDDIYF